ncbi:MotA/TolQ/ExbB proton channel family protein [Algoriphagus halophytocola]|uniref:MotA/TolQ/ExbB proton channel family protein n=1 Tax=Algoriphagus halophytocola TaxID=2991499 RepID=A0ABY6MH31_9BACT|nr:MULTISPECIES: MotA/TolQ/ExbB proton channel family protein [unclassified Algoriphagus]UZD22789.1 MotA/TolQ/ExbB proton channel family protein [Algoriphagus sp. TR-M5]WBL44055.1 MotA/TolQ/ExbB proton channel family protein [Algoriphagus sp. TR-M9]
MTSILVQKLVLSNVIIDRFQEGGLLGMTLVLICLLLAVVLAFKAFSNLHADLATFLKYKKLVNQVVLLGLVISFLNSLLGLIQAFDSLEATGGGDPAIIAGGLKVTLLSPLFGLFVFVLGYSATFVLSWMRRAEREEA